MLLELSDTSIKERKKEKSPSEEKRKSNISLACRRSSLSDGTTDLCFAFAQTLLACMRCV